MSHLPAQDLLTVKLVSRRFYILVTSPIAWSNAFSKYFPGPESLRNALYTSGHDGRRDTLQSEPRMFTRLSASVSWSSEYLARTRLIRCLIRGRPSLPFAAPCPGKPGKGSATFTFASKIWRGCTALDADFGSIFDKRKPQFVHGSALSGSVTNSDRRGKSDAWGFSNPVFFRHFHEIHPGHEPYGLGTGTCVGRPNIMELSQLHGMVYAECTPGGNVQFLPVGEKHARTLTSFTGISNPKESIPQALHDSQSPCAVWIAKSPAANRLSQGMIGILVGSSNGIITAYSLGYQGAQRFDRGEMTARWVISPGVPIVAVCADEHVNEERQRAGRIWAFALNALGELFYLNGLPEPATQAPLPRNATPEELAEMEELRAWRVGQTISWRMAFPSIRVEQYTNSSKDREFPWLPPHVVNMAQPPNPEEETRKQQSWLGKTPIEIRSDFDGWDMRRRLIADFACDDGNGAGEIVLMVAEGSEETNGSIVRFKRSRETLEGATRDAQEQEQERRPILPKSATSAALNTSWSFSDVPTEPATATKQAAPHSLDVWYQTRYLPGRYKSMQITATALDSSVLALTTLEEDQKLQTARLATRHRGPRHTEPVSESGQHRTIPGRRARLFAVGSATGVVVVWDIRASTSAKPDIVNDVQPVRVIFTDSPGIASLALSSLYLVHGGTEGLLQAWDPLASITEPIRTLSSRRLVNNRRRAIIAAQQASVPPTWAAQNPERLAASAICLDPDPTVLRGVATIDSWVKYWSYSSASAAEDMTRSQKRKMKRGNASRNANVGGSNEGELAWSGHAANQRRANLKGYVSHELHLRDMDEADRRRELKEDRRFAGRFGTELLGADASEEDMLAYAKLLSEEENEKRLRASAEAHVKLPHDASSDVVEAHKAALSADDVEKWKFASWQQRFEMLPEGGVALPQGQSDVATPTAEDPDVKRAMDLSLQEQSEQERDDSAQSSSLTAAAAAGSSKQAISAHELQKDPDLAEAIALSLTQAQTASSTPPPNSSQTEQGTTEEEDDLARAIRLSLAEQSFSSPPADATREASPVDEDDFPFLPSSSPPTSSGKSKGKGKRGAW